MINIKIGSIDTNKIMDAVVAEAKKVVELALRELADTVKEMVLEKLPNVSVQMDIRSYNDPNAEHVVFDVEGYKSNIHIVEEPTASGIPKFRVEVAPVEHESGWPVQLLAAMYEAGSAAAAVSPHPHWRPTITQVETQKNKLAKVIAKTVAEEIHKRLG